jgi:hypothetical protein
LIAGRGILDLRGGTGGTDLFATVVKILPLLEEMGLVCGRIGDTGFESLRDGEVTPVLAGCCCCWVFVRNDDVVVGFFKRLIFIFVITDGLDLTVFVILLVSWRVLRKVGVGRERSVSSKFRESDFDVVDNELALRYSKQMDIYWWKISMNNIPSRFVGIIKLLLICCCSWWRVDVFIVR